MDPEELKAVLRRSGTDIWSLIKGAIAMAAQDHASELRNRRDAIVEQMYATTRCRNCDDGDGDGGGEEIEEEKRQPEKYAALSSSSPPTPQYDYQNNGAEKEDEEKHVEDEQSKILAIKEFLEDPDQTEESRVNLLQNLLHMDITFEALKETDIGRFVNGLRKHGSPEVRKLVKLLVRKWKDLVDEFMVCVGSKYSGAVSPALIMDGDSPQQIPRKCTPNANTLPDFGCLPNSQSCITENDSKSKGITASKSVHRQDAPAKPIISTLQAASSARAKEQKDSLLDPDRLATARKRLHDNYQEAQNAKKQRTIQVMDIHEIPRPKNSFIARNKGSGVKHW